MKHTKKIIIQKSFLGRLLALLALVKPAMLVEAMKSWKVFKIHDCIGLSNLTFIVTQGMCASEGLSTGLLEVDLTILKLTLQPGLQDIALCGTE